MRSVGWVEQRDTHQSPSANRWVSLRSSHPTTATSHRVHRGHRENGAMSFSVASVFSVAIVLLLNLTS